MNAQPPPPSRERQGTPAVSTVQTSHVDQARSALATTFFPHRLLPLERSGEFGMSMRAVDLGPITVGRVSYEKSPVSLDFGELGEFYHFSFPLSGSVAATCGHRDTTASPDHGIIYPPEERTVITRWDAGCTQHGVRFERSALTRELEHLLGHKVRSPIEFARGVDLTSGVAAGLVRLINTLVADLDTGGALVGSPHMGRQLARTLATALLTCADHQYRGELDAPVVATRPRTVHRAIEAMHADPAHPHTVPELAEIAGCSVRALQHGFAQHVGCAPMTYLRTLRLEAVHEDLRLPDQRASIADIAHRWGFRHLGRFAADYRHRYGETPSQTSRTH